MAEYRHYAKPDPEWVDFPNNLPTGTRIDGMSRERKPITSQSGLDITELDVPARDGYQIRVRTYRPSAAKGKPLPLFIYIHGGGYVTGGLETDDTTCRALATEVPLLMLSVEYRLAPEHPFPTGFEDCHDVVKWAATPASQAQLGTDLTLGFILGGTSAGANFTAGIAHLAREDADAALTPRLTGLVLLAGNVCHPDARPAAYRDRILSVDEINDAPGLTRDSINHFAAKYAAPSTDPRCSPLLFPSHAGLSRKAYFAICGWDPRRDESLLFAQLLRGDAAAGTGTEVKENVYAGLPHGFWTTCPELEVSRRWERELVEGVRWLLE